MLRSKRDWLKVFSDQTNGTSTAIARRILGDLVHWKEDGPYAAQDVEQLASALAAYAALGGEHK